MRGGSLTRFKPDGQGGGGIGVGDFVSLVKRSTQGGLKGGWKGLKTGGPVRVYKGGMFLPGRSNLPSNRWLQSVARQNVLRHNTRNKRKRRRRRR